MADGLCSGSDRKHFAAGLVNENGVSASEKLGKCVNLMSQSCVATVVVGLRRAETVKRCANREQQNMTATGQQQQPPKKVLDAKPTKNKSASMSGAGSKGQTMAGTPNTVGNLAMGSAATSKSNNPSRATEIEKIMPQKVKNIVLASCAGAGTVSKLQQKKDLKSASAASVDMTERDDSLDQQQQDIDESPSAKKKRCSDRYDSSESSDSGVATLSCTDSSTASSDASEPGSPYSPVSVGEDANQSSTKTNMPPQMLSIGQQHQQTHRIHHSHQLYQQKATPDQIAGALIQHPQKQQNQKTATIQHQWPWNVSSNNNTISNHNNNNLSVNASSKNSVNSAVSGGSIASAKTKRVLSSNPGDIIGTAKKVRSSALSTERMHSNAGLTAAASKRLKAQQEESQSQTKITGYFKSQMKPLKAPLKGGDLSTLVTRTTSMDAQAGVISAKHINALSGKTAVPTNSVSPKDNTVQSNQRKSVAIKKDFIDLPPLAHTMPSSFKKIERKPPKVAQVAPISRKTNVSQQLKSPKKHIAIAPRTMDTSQSQNLPSSKAFQIDQTKISQPTVLLTAIRIPPQAGAQPQQLGAPGGVVSQTNKAPPLTSTKMGSVLQIPVVPNLVQIPNLLATANGANLVVNNGQLTRVANGSQYFLNGTVLKLQQISNGHSNNSTSTNGVLTMDSSALQGNILMKSSTAVSQGMPIVTSSTHSKAPALAIQQPIVAQASINGNGCHQAFLAATNQRISTQPVLMATTSGWYVLNQPTSDISNIPHKATLTTAMMCKPARTAVTSMTNTMCPPVPPLATLTSKLETSPSQGPKPMPVSMFASTPIPADLKDKTHFTKGAIENEKPLMVECPPLESFSSDVRSPSIPFQRKLESPSIVSVSPRIAPPPTISVTKEVKDLEQLAATTTPTKCAISPILSQPKTIRFPVPSGCEAGYRFGPKGTKRSDGVCYWDKCSEKYDTCSKLLDHLQTEHVNTQTGPFSCLWFGCKVRGRESCSRRWLERHVLSHGGTKPFKCIVDGCGLRLGSQLALQKHVNGHFNATESKDSLNKRASDPPIPKVLRKNGKKARYRRQPFSARMFDYFDTGIMEGLQHRLMLTGSLANGSKGAVTFQGHTIARRQTVTGITELYVKWSPSEILPDEWVSEKEGALTKTVTIQSMQYQERFALHKYLSATSSLRDAGIKTVSKSHVFPSSVESLSSLFDVTDCQNAAHVTQPSCATKQSRKPPKWDKIEPS